MEKAAIAERPTADPVAYAYYTEAKAIGAGQVGGLGKKRNREVELLEKARSAIRICPRLLRRENALRTL